MVAALALTALLLGPNDYRSRFPLPDNTFAKGWGVNIHFTDEAPGEVAQIASGGFHWVRMDFMWHTTERELGKYDFSAYDRLLRSLDANEIRPIFILDYGNDLYQKGSPRNDESRAAFCRWVSAAMAHFRHRGIVWEMWNEPNIMFWQPKPDREQYVALANRVGQTIRKDAPDEWYVGPATSGMDFGFLEGCFKAGLLNYWDAVTVHPYRNNVPETVIVDWTHLGSLVGRYEPKGKHIPLISGEWGYSDAWSEMTPEKQGLVMPRQYLSNLISGVNLSIYYDWKNDGTDPKEPEHHFGTVYPDRKPKPAYLAAQKLSSSLRGFRYQLCLSTGTPEDFVMVFTKGKDMKLVGWTTGKRHSANLKLGGKPQVVELTEEARILTVLVPASTQRVLAQWSPLPTFVEISRRDDVSLLAARISRGYAIQPASHPHLTMSGYEEVLKESESLASWIKPLDVRLRADGGVDLTQRIELFQSKPLGLGLRSEGQNVIVSVTNSRGRDFNGRVALKCSGTGRRLTKPVRISADQTEVSVSLDGITQEELGMPMGITLEQGGHVVLSCPSARVTSYGNLNSQTTSLAQDGDSKVHAEMSLGFTATEKGTAVEVSYSFPQGWKFLMLKPEGIWKEVLSGRPVSWGMWVDGDGSGNALRMRFMDSAGQAFQPDGPRLDWKGWRWVSFPLDGKSGGHWGGPADGVVRYPIRLDSLVLVDSTQSGTNPSKVRFAGFSLTTWPAN